MPVNARVGRAFVATIPNPTLADVERLRELQQRPDRAPVKFIIGQPERSPTTGTLHLQCYIVYNNSQTFDGARRGIGGPGGRAHVEIANGSSEQNIAYCTKEGDGGYVAPDGQPDYPLGLDRFEFGDRPAVRGTGSGSGNRTDIVVATEAIERGATLPEIAKDYPKTFVQYTRGLSTYAAIRSRRRDPDEPPTIYWCWGPSGSGKTRWCYQTSPEAYWKSTAHKWWDGYDGVSDVILDDYRPDFCKFHELLNMLDRYPYQVEVKGGVMQLNAKRIFITCPQPPGRVWQSRTVEDLQQLLRRITEVKTFGEPEPVFARAVGFVPE